MACRPNYLWIKSTERDKDAGSQPIEAFPKPRKPNADANAVLRQRHHEGKGGRQEEEGRGDEVSSAPKKRV